MIRGGEDGRENDSGVVPQRGCERAWKTCMGRRIETICQDTMRESCQGEGPME